MPLFIKQHYLAQGSAEAGEVTACLAENNGSLRLGLSLTSLVGVTFSETGDLHRPLSGREVTALLAPPQTLA